jgi:hypothetical protein
MKKDFTIGETIIGLGLSGMHQEDMSVLIKSKEDIEDFMVNYWTEKDKQFEAVNAYRDNKTDRNKMEFETFKCMYESNDKVRALESLYLHKVHKGHVKALEKRFTSRTLDIRKVYDWHEENKKSRLLGLVLQTTY